MRSVPHPPWVTSSAPGSTTPCHVAANLDSRWEGQLLGRELQARQDEHASVQIAESEDDATEHFLLAHVRGAHADDDERATVGGRPRRVQAGPGASSMIGPTWATFSGGSGQSSYTRGMAIRHASARRASATVTKSGPIGSGASPSSARLALTTMPSSPRILVVIRSAVEAVHRVDEQCMRDRELLRNPSERPQQVVDDDDVRTRVRGRQQPHSGSSRPKKMGRVERAHIPCWAWSRDGARLLPGTHVTHNPPPRHAERRRQARRSVPDGRAPGAARPDRQFAAAHPALPCGNEDIHRTPIVTRATGLRRIVNAASPASRADRPTLEPFERGCLAGS